MIIILQQGKDQCTLQTVLIMEILVFCGSAAFQLNLLPASSLNSKI